jgi:hypothetical protein
MLPSIIVAISAKRSVGAAPLSQAQVTALPRKISPALFALQCELSKCASEELLAMLYFLRSIGEALLVSPNSTNRAPVSGTKARSDAHQPQDPALVPPAGIRFYDVDVSRKHEIVRVGLSHITS